MSIRLILFFMCLCACSPGNSQNKPAMASGDVRPPAVAGQFYPGNADELKNMVTQVLGRAKKEDLTGDLMGLVCPHAGYVFSASVAAYSYRQLTRKKYDCVVIIGRSHHDAYPYAAVYPSGSFATPLGQVAVNSALTDQLLQNSALFRADKEPHAPEHSIEVQLPFLQTVLDSFTIVPLLLGFDDYKTSVQVAQLLAPVLKGKNALIVASTDMSHYPAYDDANRIDRATLDSWKTMQPDVIVKTEARLMGQGVANEHCTMCATSAVLTTILTCRALGAANLKVLKYANSGDVTDDRSRVVGYGAAVIYKEK